MCLLEVSVSIRGVVKEVSSLRILRLASNVLAMSLAGKNFDNFFVTTVFLQCL